MKSNSISTDHIDKVCEAEQTSKKRHNTGIISFQCCPFVIVFQIVLDFLNLHLWIYHQVGNDYCKIITFYRSKFIPLLRIDVCEV